MKCWQDLGKNRSHLKTHARAHARTHTHTRIYIYILPTSASEREKNDEES